MVTVTNTLPQPTPGPIIPTVGVTPAPCSSCSEGSPSSNTFIGAIILLVIIIVLVSSLRGEDDEFRIRVRKRR